MKTKLKKSKGFSLSAGIVIVSCYALALCVFEFVLGANQNFINNDPANHPANLMGTIYKGGFIVPIIQSLFLTVLVLSVERFIAIGKAQGKGKVVKFVEDVKEALSNGNIKEAQTLCDKQQGSVGNVTNAALKKYVAMTNETGMTKEQKLLSIQKEIEEATALEMPTLEQNLPVVASLTTLGTLLGLLGTVIGMIKSFAALANAGAPDSIALSTGISEALINTAFGIATAASAVISYNYFTTRIDGLTHAIDEVGFSIVQTFATTQK
jgi:biopolymer transport protein ExbB